MEKSMDIKKTEIATDALVGTIADMITDYREDREINSKISEITYIEENLSELVRQLREDVEKIFDKDIDDVSDEDKFTTIISVEIIEIIFKMIEDNGYKQRIIESANDIVELK